MYVAYENPHFSKSQMFLVVRASVCVRMDFMLACIKSDLEDWQIGKQQINQS